MKLQTSFYNKAILRSDLKRFGFVGIIYFILSFLINNVGVIPNMFSNYKDTMVLDNNFLMVMPNAWDMTMVFFVPVVLAVVLFRYLQEEKALSTIHALPVTRKALYVSHFMAFTLIYCVPVILNGLISIGIILMKGYPVIYTISNGGIGILLTLIAAITIFTIAVLFGMMVGSSVLQAVLTYIMMGIPVAIVEMTRVLISWTLRGYPHVMNEYDWQYFATPYYSIVMMMTREGKDIIALIVVIAFLLASLVLSYILYQKRDLERHHDLIAFDFAKIGFVGLLTVLITLALSTLIGGLMDESTGGAYVGLIAGSLLGFFVTKMIAEKTIAVLKYYKQAFLVLAIFVFALIIIDLDLVGYESHIPEDEDIAYIYYSENSYMSYSEMIDIDNSINLGSQSTIRFVQAESIDKIQALHQHLIDDIEPEMDENGYYELNSQGVNVVYVLKNGRRVQRTYDDFVEDQYVMAIHDLDEYKDYYLSEFQSALYGKVDLEVRLYGGLGDSELLSEEQVKSLYEVYAIDFRQLGYYEEKSYDSLATIEISSVVKQNQQSMYNSYETRNYVSVPIWPSFDNTKAWLKMNGYEDLVPSLDGVVSVAISRNGRPYYYEKEYPIDPNQAYEYQLIEDPAMIKELFELGYDYSQPLNESLTITFNYEDYRSFSFKRANVPPEFEPYINQY